MIVQYKRNNTNLCHMNKHIRYQHPNISIRINNINNKFLVFCVSSKLIDIRSSRQVACGRR